ncbi:MAG: DUF1329 domain-containing protein [bacterium]|jgi:hypothetical protein|nr:DUF1329 domain-containing protein [Gammaproteobacteria bacterium]HIL82325.1 DUF1329 domain-containing protein [Pseudomonadales bacterium]
MSKLFETVRFGLLSGLLATASVSAQGSTDEDFLRWLEANQNAAVDFSDGELITYDNADKIRAFVPLGYQDEMIFEGMEVQIKDAGDISPSSDYKEATKLHQAKVSLGADGAIEGYVAGMPFDPATFKPGDDTSGLKAAWNFSYRWQHEGLKIKEVKWVWVRGGGNHDDHEIMRSKYADLFSGGGKFERVLAGPYQRVYFNFRADLADQNYAVEGKWSATTEFRELTAFEDPFDIAGTAFLILRHTNPRKADDSWAYLPSLRRVRRISVEVKYDSLLGTDHTLEDFYCFAGRVLEHDWSYLGTARILAVARSRYRDTHYYGPNGWTPKDDWALREVDVFQQKPKSDSHPYSHKYIMSDRQSGEAYYCNAFDRAGELWKVWQLSKVFTEDAHYSEPTYWKIDETPAGARVSAFQSINVIDKQNNRGTLVPTLGHSYPDNSIRYVRRKLDVNYLTEGK